jgi:hypothetical protein
MQYFDNESQYQHQTQQSHKLNELALRRQVNGVGIEQRTYNQQPLLINSNSLQYQNSNNLQRNFYNSRLSAPNHILSYNQTNVPTYSMNNSSAPVISQAPLPIASIPIQTNQPLPFRPETSRVMVLSRNAENNDLELTAKKLEKFRVIQNGEREVFRDGVRIIYLLLRKSAFISLLNLDFNNSSLQILYLLSEQISSQMSSFKLCRMVL